MRHPALPAPRTRRRTVMVAGALAIGLALGACGSSASGASTTTSAPAAKSTTTTQSATTTTLAPMTGTTMIDGRPIKIPTEGGARPIDSLRDKGQQIVIATAGLYPQTLFVCPFKPITWTNLTAKPVTVRFVLYPPSKGFGPVVPGGTHTYTPPGRGAVAYRTSSGLVGQVQIGVFPTTINC